MVIAIFSPLICNKVFKKLLEKMSRILLLQLTVVLISAVTYSGATSVGNSADKANLDLHRLKNAIYPFRNEIKATWTRRPTTAQEDSQGPLTCHLCNAVMPLVRNWINEYTNEQLRDMVIDACKSMGLAPRPSICEPIITAYTNQFLYVIANTTSAQNDSLPSAQICGVLTPDCDHPVLTDWNVKIEGDKPNLEDREILKATDSPTTTILQFTDLHVDLDYMIGTNTDCGEGMPICCREYEGIPEDVKKQAGPYGDFRCALPIDTFKILLQDAKERYPETRYIFLTGDYIHSGVWLYNVTENGRHVRAVTRAVAEIFPDKSIPIYPLVGNHEPQVVNMYPPKHLWQEPDFDLAWLYHDVMEPFRQRDPGFLPDPEYTRFIYGGYYSVNPEPGLKIIVLNTNLCSPENFWLGYNPYNIVREQLQWLADVLKSAEDAGESVLIVGHIEPGSCFSGWSDKFNKVVDRFEGIIRGSFFGHSHKPQYRVSMAKGTMRPVFGSYIAGSGLPDKMHPAYSVFHVDGERGEEISKWDVLRHQLVVMNLTESNKLEKPVFKRLTDSYEDFKMENLSPSSILKFANSLVCNQGLVDRYLKFHTKGDDTPDHKPCNVTDSTCMKNILCNIVSSNANDSKPCQEFEWAILESPCSTSGAKQSVVAFGIFAAVLLLFLGFH